MRRGQGRCTTLIYGSRCTWHRGHDGDHEAFAPDTLPNFVPIEAMSRADKLAHLAYMHRQIIRSAVADYILDSCHRAEHEHFMGDARPHTHDRAPK